MNRKLAAAAAIGLALSVTGAAIADSRVARPTVRVEPDRGACIAPAEEMRRNHMELLKHQRDRTLRLGERGAKVSLNACIECHAGTKTGSVIGKDDFCESCHSYAAVTLDCFECHQGKPGTKATKISEKRP